MPDEQREGDSEYVEASDGFDHPNVTQMDDQYLVTMNNELLRKGYIKSGDVDVVKAEVNIMGAMERLYAAGYYDVDTARGIEAGKFTLHRAIEASADGFTAKLDKSQINYEVQPQPRKGHGFFHNPFKKEEPQYAPMETRR